MKKDFFVPAMRVVEMKHKCHILAGSLYSVKSTSTNLGDDDFIFQNEGSSGQGLQLSI